MILLFVFFWVGKNYRLCIKIVEILECYGSYVMYMKIIRYTYCSWEKVGNFCIKNFEEFERRYRID